MNTSNKRPAYVAIIFTATEGDQKEWQKIGAAWPAEMGRGFNLRLDQLPPAGETVYLRRPRGGEQKQAREAGQ